jgi:hypothetical protein
MYVYMQDYITTYKGYTALYTWPTVYYTYALYTI